MTNKTYFAINFINGTIDGIAKAFAEAGKGYGPAYEQLVDLMTKHPNFRPNEIEDTSKPKRSFAGLKMELIKEYIAIQDNAEDLQKELEEVKKVAKAANKKMFPMVKRWFLDIFNQNHDFSVTKAEEEIKKANIAKAKKNANNKIIEMHPQDKAVNE